ncbi:hypothetical protein K461DRAFT_276092 [Myriangium duriaei CBS 260.36]|uniref:Uncharacterized protein n=1 Tax=Myriangium duriaei CBS 260.36 TaxID=1168546 RepID=A0A9P4J9T3_9PEZI|nr:hypothetical protein K461DRAFT_276092 [Myriangium duriaei CBS 260.36]
MFPRRRLITFLLACLLLLALRRYYLQPGVTLFRDKDQGRGRVILPDLRKGLPAHRPWRDVFPLGKPKTTGSEYSRTIVMASMSADNVSWVDWELRDLLAPNGPFEKAIYVADDRTAPLHPVKNKGHEAMIYMSYIIDNYEDLPDISIFVHSDRWTWHNNELMDNDLAGMIRYLSPERVTREGYMNLRCHWDPGCPSWLHLKGRQAQDNIQKHEEKAIKERWHELFPMDDMPDILSQPCCAQFALSRNRILEIPKQRYVYLRSWILRTPLNDYRSGRVFEYLWQYLFTGNAEVCPAMHICYCDGYGLCFGGAKEFDDWFELRYKRLEFESQIRRLKGEFAPGDTKSDKKSGVKPNSLKEVDDNASRVPKTSLEQLQQEVNQVKDQLQKLRDEAFLRGGSDKARAKEAGRS